MKLTQRKNGEQLIVCIEGSIDTTTAMEFDSQLAAMLPEVQSLVLDFAQVPYVSSAGLRSVLKANKAMLARKGEMCLQHVNPEVMKLFAITGFQKILAIRQD